MHTDTLEDAVYEDLPQEVPGHTSVLLREAVEALAIDPADTVVDATLGGAGHFSLLLSALGKEGTLVGIDADPAAVERARMALEAHAAAALPTVHLVENNFCNLNTILAEQGIRAVDKVLFDLGWSGYQLSAGRGFSFRVSEPLLMTYTDGTVGETAADIVNSASESELVDLLFTYGEERFARGIAKSITRVRKHAPILTTDDLVAAIEAGTPAWYHHRRLHPATKTFQALRIAVNDELGALRQGLACAIEHLAPGGRVAVISFHSIEDRIVKTMLRDAAHAGKGMLVTRKPLSPSAQECLENPRARSAKLRVFEGGVASPSPLDISKIITTYV